jgi:hypothetical protein
MRKRGGSDANLTTFAYQTSGCATPQMIARMEAMRKIKHVVVSEI